VPQDLDVHLVLDNYATPIPVPLALASRYERARGAGRGTAVVVLLSGWVAPCREAVLAAWPEPAARLSAGRSRAS